ncbi:GSCOCT00014177001.2-RA-CDS [Cotesia congregata]|uniref:Venom protein 9 n=1 Tax=Cotesia congregata TaxID=51543 RepID=A0A8J2EGP7_COTCN|nr:GSCOCT00014177001.2-RA-CDS [Cotesia congregata]CAG5075116.1 Putative venom protein 9 [Cotesia congregata]
MIKALISLILFVIAVVAFVEEECQSDADCFFSRCLEGKCHLDRGAI